MTESRELTHGEVITELCTGNLPQQLATEVRYALLSPQSAPVRRTTKMPMATAKRTRKSSVSPTARPTELEF
jgi:hypothetical protein